MRRGLLVVLMACALAACGRGDDPSPFADSHTPPGLAERFYPPEGWGWGFLQVGDGPVQRYGVAAPAVVPRAQILILPGYGETAETWFETARDLNDLGYAVWVLEGVGQGGSERLTGRRDLGHVKSFNPDVAAVKAMARVVIRSGADAPLVILGQGTGAIVAARAVETGLAPSGLILSAPVWRVAAAAPGLPWIGVQRAPGGLGWRGSGPDAFIAGLTHDRWRGHVTHAWQGANPDLRMGDPSSRWLIAFNGLARLTRAGLHRVDGDVLIVEPEVSQGCASVTHCRDVEIAGARRSLELESAPWRGPWLAAIDAFVRARLHG